MGRSIIQSSGLKDYVPLPTIKKFHECNDVFRCIRGPLGSGKSVGCVMEMFIRSLRQQPWNGIRKSRWAIIRNTHSQLVGTSMETFRSRLPEYIDGEEFAPIRGEMRGNYRARIRKPLPDGTALDMDVVFCALDRAEDANKIKSLDLTGAWINELSEIEQEILLMVIGRTGRYPPTDEGGYTWRGVIADTNPPPEDHFLATMEIERPEIEFDGKKYRYSFFVQPPALLKETRDGKVIYVSNRGQGGLPPAENIENLGDGYGYYISMLPTASESWINVYILGNFGRVSNEKRVYHEWNDQLHRSKEEIMPLRNFTLLLGIDWGFSNSACVIGQIRPNGQLLILDEIYTEKSGIKTFIDDILKPVLMDKYSGMNIQAFGDPSGGSHSNVDGSSCIQVANDLGIPTESASSNDPLLRQEAVRGYLSRLIDGQPGFLISPKCKRLIDGFNGGYHYKKAPGSSTKVLERVDKNQFSHVHDALQYLCLGIPHINTRYDPFGLDRKTDVIAVKRSNYYWG